MPALRRLLLLTLFLAGSHGSAAQPAPLVPSLEVRAGYVGVWPEGEAASHTGQARVLSALTWRPRADLQLRAGAAARLATDQGPLRVLSPGRQEGPGGLRPGGLAVHELHATWVPAPGWEIRAGRVQLRFPLPGVAPKGLLRHDSPNVNVHWSDALHLQAEAGGRAHLALIHTPASGVSTAFRGPLSFGEGSGRAAVFAGWETQTPAGPLVHRAVLATVLPGALPDPGGRRAYAAGVVQGAAVVPAGGPRVMLAAEAGWSPTPPERGLLGLEGTARGVVAAGQASVNLLGFGGGAHDLGVVALVAAPGWLLSPDIPSNARDAEVRYQWRVAPRWRLDFRVRHRRELVARAEAPRTAWDAFARVNFRL